MLLDKVHVGIHSSIFSHMHWIFVWGSTNMREYQYNFMLTQKTASIYTSPAYRHSQQQTTTCEMFYFGSWIKKMISSKQMSMWKKLSSDFIFKFLWQTQLHTMNSQEFKLIQILEEVWWHSNQVVVKQRPEKILQVRNDAHGFEVYCACEKTISHQACNTVRSKQRLADH
jgi:hypothetical protein